MPTKQDVIAEARTWLGTRYHHQARIKGVGVDCGGLVFAVGAHLGLFPPSPMDFPKPEQFVGYARLAHNGSLLRACQMVMEEIPAYAAEPGDVILMTFTEDKEPQHVGILGDYVHGGLSLIHSYAPARRVVETRLDDGWRSRIVAAFALPGVNA